jgi:hypothetical protein
MTRVTAVMTKEAHEPVPQDDHVTSVSLPARLYASKHTDRSKQSLIAWTAAASKSGLSPPSMSAAA